MNALYFFVKSKESPLLCISIECAIGHKTEQKVLHSEKEKQKPLFVRGFCFTLALLYSLIMIDTKSLRTWIEIDTPAIRHNIETFRTLVIGNTKLAAVVKSNAYGHDFKQFVAEASRVGVDFFCVDDIDEALTIRSLGLSEPVLVLGTVPEARLAEAGAHHISITVSNFEKLEQIKNLSLSIHIKIDTGLGRQGFLEGDREKLIKALHLLQGPKIEGIYSHFASAKESNSEYSAQQAAIFKTYVEAFQKEGWTPIAHISSTAGAILWPEYNFDMVRVGIGLYGLWPSISMKEKFESKVLLKPLLSWKCILPEIKILPRGSSIGYGLTHTLGEDTQIGILPIGYWHGYPRHLSGKGRVIVQGKEAKVIGIVSMDMAMIDLNNISNPQIGDIVEIIGPTETAYHLAEKIDTSHYEIVTRINQDIIRIYT